MKFKKLCALIALYFLFSSCAAKSIHESADQEILSIWAGSFDSNYHSDEVILNWTLYNNGTMSGIWKTQKGSFAIDVKGFYKIQNNKVTFNGTGTLNIYNNNKTQVKITGEGKIEQKLAQGGFHLEIAHPGYPEDNGTWLITML